MRLLLAVTSVVALLAGTASAQDACGRPAETLNAVQANRSDSMVLARTAAVCGLPWSGADILEPAVLDRPTVIERFNLAALYQSTERPEYAASLYLDLIDDGRFQSIILDTPIGDRTARPERVNVSAESARRYQQLRRRLAIKQPTAAIGDPAEASGRQSKFEALIGAAHVPADRALVFDGLAAEPQ